jgi:hypothetical protein
MGDVLVGPGRIAQVSKVPISHIMSGKPLHIALPPNDFDTSHR